MVVQIRTLCVGEGSSDGKTKRVIGDWREACPALSVWNTP